MSLTTIHGSGIKPGLCAAVLLMLAVPVAAQEGGKETEIQQRLDAQAAAGKESNATLVDLQKQLEEQQKTIEQQKKEIDRQKETLNKQQEQIATTTDLLQNMQSQIDQLANPTKAPVADPPATSAPAGGQVAKTTVDDPAADVQTATTTEAQQPGEPTTAGQMPALTPDEVALRERLAKLESQAKKITDDPSSVLADASFPGAIRVPGTTAAYKFGGFVKASIVKNFDPLNTKDRFIVGGIAVTDTDQQALASETNFSANQSRINFDYRQQTKAGNLRAFIEGDFTEDDDTFRLRHSFGQFRDFLAGKTWSAFYDAQAAPEEVDFEGVNGYVNRRNTQVRYFPKIGKDWQWMISLEDPDPQVTGGNGVSDLPDLVTSIRREWFNRWHMKTALIMRQLRSVNSNGVDVKGQACDPVAGTVPGDTDIEGCQAISRTGSTEKEHAWGLTASGNIQAPWLNENDNFIFQVTYGEGIGRYINDLSSVSTLGVDGGQDAVTDPLTGRIEALPVFSGYLAYQHWWGDGLRSTFLISQVVVNNDEAQSPEAYHKTARASANLIWSPISNIDIGTELLWGKRVNNDNEDGTATQLQFEAKYRF